MQVRRDPEAIPAASIGDNQAETGRRTNITSGTGYGGRSRIMINWGRFFKIGIAVAMVATVLSLVINKLWR
jgi:hypothetical protein